MISEVFPYRRDLKKGHEGIAMFKPALQPGESFAGSCRPLYITAML